MDIPADRKYTAEHEWVLATEDGNYRVGITDYAQDALGDVVYVELPEAGAAFAANATMAEVESTKSVAEVYAPVAGTIVASNEALVANPGLINSDPYGEAWFVVIAVDDAASIEGLLDADGYKAITD